MFKNSRLRSKEYERLSTRFETDIDLARDFAKMRGQREGTAFGKTYGITFDEVVMLKGIATKYVTLASTNNYSISINKKEDSPVTHVVEGAVSAYFRDLLEGSTDEFNKADMMNMFALAMMMPVDYKKGSSSVIPPTKIVPEQLHHCIAPIANTVRILDQNEITTHQDAVKVVADELIDAESNLSLMLNYVDSSPSDCKIVVTDEAIKEAEVKKRLLIVKCPSFRAPNAAKITPEAALVMYNTMCTGGFSANCPGNGFLLRHVYGIRFRSDMMKYISFLTDFVVSDNITTIHLHHKDSKYAIGLMNMYPKMKIVVKGTGTVKDAAMLKISTKADMYKEAKLENVIGVFVKAKKYSKPEKKADLCEYAQIQDGPISDEIKQYKNFFRYMDPRAMRKDCKYRQSINTAANLCIESNIGPCISYNDMWYRMAVALMHRQLLPWHLKPLINMYPEWYPPLHSKYSFIVTKSIADAIEMSGFLNFVHDSKDNDFLKYIAEASEGNTMAAGQKKGYAKDLANAKKIVARRDAPASNNRRSNNNNAINYEEERYDDNNDDDNVRLVRKPRSSRGQAIRNSSQHRVRESPSRDKVNKNNNSEPTHNNARDGKQINIREKKTQYNDKQVNNRSVSSKYDRDEYNDEYENDDRGEQDDDDDGEDDHQSDSEEDYSKAVNNFFD